MILIEGTIQMNDHMTCDFHDSIEDIYKEGEKITDFTGENEELVRQKYQEKCGFEVIKIDSIVLL